MGYIKISEAEVEDTAFGGGTMRSVKTEIMVSGVPAVSALGMLLHAYLELYNNAKHDDCTDPNCPYTDLFTPAYEQMKKLVEGYDADVDKKINGAKYNHT